MADPVFRRALRNTFLYVALVLREPSCWDFSLLCSCTAGPGAFVLQVIYFLPVTSTLIAMATVWQAILHPRLGPIDAALRFSDSTRSPS